MRSMIAAALFSLVALPASAQQAAAPTARPADVASVDAIMNAVYDVISGDSGVARDWDRFRSLFHPEARLVPVVGRPGGAFQPLVLSVNDYVSRAGPALERGFHEREIGRRQETYGPIVHIFSTYESRRRAGDAQPFARGINSFQLYHDGSRYWVMQIFWWGETPGTPIPQRYFGVEKY